ncbi:hypothetical protein EJ05DRAFT_514765 [Pseudovirgaria hyperparasitica]|uniref:Aminoglycoside phosphotransferase domain-containing protein n=1 Tax=Pseudovirgaria hyperparasitica TaxID=470096 RepID=A0A6A6VTZ5_9PEZI|nr:uncharacterized protein EJ05DRAFT_514765 [Pseudovirgaria hyperparasitica]KAF2753266.1 hypothetical protein EJ05DRAFT_514765 [Pseudovirgaria hyperparasitica]
MAQIYSLDNAIAKFFHELRGVNRQQCEELALSLVGPPLQPCRIQGAFSYTIRAGPGLAKIIQFRSEYLDMHVLECARLTFGTLVAACVHHGHIGNPSRLGVYVMDNLPGVTYIEARMAFPSLNGMSKEMCIWQNNVVVDLARFFALSWKRPLKLNELEVTSCRNDMEQKLRLLSKTLPSPFSDTMTDLANNVGILFSDSYPLVLTHDDLCEMNILVDSATGNLTGVIDWANASIQPFGLALWGVENVFGYMDGTGWHYFGNYEQLKELFWRKFEEDAGVKTITLDFKENLKLARLVGIALRYGYKWDNLKETKPISTDDPSLRYLIAFLSG